MLEKVVVDDPAGPALAIDSYEAGLKAGFGPRKSLYLTRLVKDEPVFILVIAIYTPLAISYFKVCLRLLVL
jgi:hypothetical protein